jgi:hypothetical protein
MQQSKLATANMQNLVSLYLISQKYHFEEHETFARDLLHQHCVALAAEPSTADNYFFQCSESRLHSLLRIVVLTDRINTSVSFKHILQGIWVQRLRKTMALTSFALGVAEALGLRVFMAELYYLELTRLKPALVKGSVAYAHPNTSLSPHQELVLYRGSWSLRCYWSNMTAVARQKTFMCHNNLHICQQIWDGRWNTCISEYDSRPFDPLQELWYIRDAIEAVDERRIPCALKSIIFMINQLTRSFATHFLGPLPTPTPAAELPP